jgi:hypothetical protein
MRLTPMRLATAYRTSNVPNTRPRSRGSLAGRTRPTSTVTRIRFPHHRVGQREHQFERILSGLDRRGGQCYGFHRYGHGKRFRFE